MSNRRIIQVEEKVPILEGIPLSLQHLFAMFGASVLVPYLFNSAAGAQVVDPALVLLMNGIGTLIYLFLCKGRAPAFLGSSFAFLGTACSLLAANADKAMTWSKVLGGFVASGLVFIVVSLIIGSVGTGWLKVLLPPATMGPIVAIIGLELASTAAGNAGIIPTAQNPNLDPKTILVSMVTLAVVVLGSLIFRGFLSVIPVLVAVIAGYLLALSMGMVTFGTSAVHLVSMPAFVLPSIDIAVIAAILPATLVVISEHIGHLFVTSKIVNRDLAKDPGLHRSMLGDGISTFLSGMCGSVPTTTYGENMGVMAITRVYSVWVIGGAAVISIAMAFIGPVAAFINSIPTAVMGGISLLLFGIIAASGIRLIVEAKVDYSKSRNLILTSLTLMAGLSGVSVSIGGVALKGMPLATLFGMALSLLFYVLDQLKVTSELERDETADV